MFFKTQIFRISFCYDKYYVLTKKKSKNKNKIIINDRVFFMLLVGIFVTQTLKWICMFFSYSNYIASES